MRDLRALFAFRKRLSRSGTLREHLAGITEAISRFVVPSEDDDDGMRSVASSIDTLSQIADLGELPFAACAELLQRQLRQRVSTDSAPLLSGIEMAHLGQCQPMTRTTIRHRLAASKPLMTPWGAWP